MKANYKQKLITIRDGFASYILIYSTRGHYIAQYGLIHLDDGECMFQPTGERKADVTAYNEFKNDLRHRRMITDKELTQLLA